MPLLGEDDSGAMTGPASGPRPARHAHTKPKWGERGATRKA